MLRRILVVCVLVCAVAACAAETPRYWVKKDTVAATLEAALDALDRGRVRQGDWQAIGAFPKSAKRPGPDPAKADSCAVYSVDPRSGKKELRRPAPKKTGRQRAVRKKAMASCRVDREAAWDWRLAAL